MENDFVWSETEEEKIYIPLAVSFFSPGSMKVNERSRPDPPGIALVLVHFLATREQNSQEFDK
jgi:hypothetical protein